MIDLSDKHIIEEIQKLLPNITNYELLAIYLECKRLAKEQTDG